jgi:hypothetical protein
MYQMGVVAARIWLPCVVVVFACCGEGGDEPDAALLDVGVDTILVDTSTDLSTGLDGSKKLSVVGDWFKCTDSSCSTLSYKGYRHGADGFYRELYASPPLLEPSEKYCYINNPKLLVQYKHIGDQMIVTVPNTTVDIKVKILKLTADILVLEPTPGETRTLKRIDPPRASGPCDAQDPWVCPNVSTMGGGKLCGWTWKCDNGEFKLTCVNTTEQNYSCECSEKGQKILDFSAKDVCTSMSQDGPIDLVNANCNWKIWKP